MSLIVKNEIRCLSCICAGCMIEYSCKEKPCNDSTNPFDCVLVSSMCDTHDKLYENTLNEEDDLR